MAPRAFDTSLNENEMAEVTAQSLSAKDLAGVGMGMEECDFISDSEFKMLMTLVAIATLAFGCIVNGWLI